MALSDPLSIKLKFGNRILPMVVERADEYIYREAEKLINGRFNYYASKYPEQGHEMYLLMTSLDIAVRYKRMEISVDPAPMQKAIEALIAEVEQSLK
ncbi:MAG: cell division protein ZapA [Bacteroidaceae bacterium]|nr:cell division protein ZapA [Bacteroidaceae bacterium]